MTAIFYSYASDNEIKLPDLISQDWGHNLQFVCACKCPPSRQSRTLMSLNTTCRLDNGQIQIPKYELTRCWSAKILLVVTETKVCCVIVVRAQVICYLKMVWVVHSCFLATDPRLGRGERWIMEISGDKLGPGQTGPEWDETEMIRRNEWRGETIHWNTGLRVYGWWLAKNSVESFFLIKRKYLVFTASSFDCSSIFFGR